MTIILKIFVEDQSFVMRLWIVCYDISDDSTRAHVSEFLLDNSMKRVQRSVFEGYLSSRQIADLIRALRTNFCLETDALSAYPVRNNNSRARKLIGRLVPQAGRLPNFWLF